MKIQVFLCGMVLAASGVLSGCARQSSGARGAVAARVSGTKYALLVGISHYERRISRYDIPAAAEAGRNAQALQKFAGFEARNITVLTDKGPVKPTRDNILRQIELLSHKIKPTDSVFVYFGGHGFSLSERDYLAPWDAGGHSDEARIASSLPVSLLLSRLGQVHAKVLVTVCEACREDQSPPYEPDARPTAAPTPSEQQVLAPEPRPGATIYSCREGEDTYSCEGNSRGCFSYRLQRGLQGAAADTKGNVTIGSLSSYLTKAVFGDARLRYGVSQQPVTVINPAGLQRVEEVVLASGLPPGNAGTTVQPFGSPRFAVQKYRNQMQAAYEALLRGDKAGAEREFEAALRTDPKSQRAVTELASLCDERGDWPGAQGWYKRSVHLWPADVTRLNKLGEAALAGGNFAQAEVDFRVALVENAWVVPMKNLGLVYLQRRQYPLAEYWFKRAYTSAPDWPEPLLDLAWLKAFQKQNAEASRLYAKLVQISPRSTYTLFNVALFYQHSLKNLSRAEQFYRQAIRVEPRRGCHYANLAGCLLDENKRAEALILARHAIALGYRANHQAYRRLHLQAGSAKPSRTPHS